ncbi:hypothetical protein AB205_0005390, partial [Aquarana catesbeiana]
EAYIVTRLGEFCLTLGFVLCCVLQIKWMASMTTTSSPVHRQVQGAALSVAGQTHYNHKQKKQTALEKLLELEDLSQDEVVECGTQEEAVECGSQEEAGEASTSLRATPTPEEAFACMAATKLQGMQEGQRQLCEDLLYKVLTKGMRGKITPNTHVSELDHPPPPPATIYHHSHSMEGSMEGRPESDDLGSVWSGKRCRLLYDHSLGTQMSSAAFRISETSGPDCTLLDMDSSGHKFCSKIIDVCPGGQRLHQFLLFIQRCLPLCLVMSP